MKKSELGATPNSDIASLPGAHRDVQEGVAPLTTAEQLVQLNQFFEDNYPDIFASLTTDEGAEYTAAGKPVPDELRDATERKWSKVPDLLTHSSQLVLGAGLDHAMPHVAFTRDGVVAEAWTGEELPEGVTATVLRPTGDPAVADDVAPKVAIALHGGPGWFGDGMSHDQLWQPLFAALAKVSGITIVDLTYPLPAAAGGVLKTREAVRDAATAIARTYDLNTEGESGRAPGTLGAVVFGSGFGAAVEAWPMLSWLVALSPRVPTGLSLEPKRGLAGVDAVVSLATEDSRATPEAEVREFFDEAGADASYQQFCGEHIIAPPAVWRERVTAAAQWMAQQ